MKNRISVVLTLLMLALCFPGVAKADSISFLYNQVISGDTPAESVPWLSATFDDEAAAAGWDVRLTFSAYNLAPGVENVEEWYFNLDPLLDPLQLLFNAVDVSDSNPENGKKGNGIFTGTDAFKADGDGLYDLNFNFPPPLGTFDARFTDNETVVYDIKNADNSLTAQSFNFFSSTGGGEGTYLSAAHIQNTPGLEGSSWVGSCSVVPEPVSAVLGVLGAGVMLLRRRERCPDTLDVV